MTDEYRITLNVPREMIEALAERIAELMVEHNATNARYAGLNDEERRLFEQLDGRDNNPTDAPQ
jgi:hypothetical protein